MRAIALVIDPSYLGKRLHSESATSSDHASSSSSSSSFFFDIHQMHSLSATSHTQTLVSLSLLSLSPRFVLLSYEVLLLHSPEIIYFAAATRCVAPPHPESLWLSRTQILLCLDSRTHTGPPCTQISITSLHLDPSLTDTHPTQIGTPASGLSSPQSTAVSIVTSNVSP